MGSRAYAQTGSTIQQGSDVKRQSLASDIVQELAGHHYTGRVVLFYNRGGVVGTEPPQKPTTGRKLLKQFRPYLPAKLWSGEIIIDSHMGAVSPELEFVAK